MKAEHRKLLKELMDYCNTLGGALDGTSTNEAKYRDRQKMHTNSYKVLLAILSDHPDNDQRDFEFEVAKKALAEMKQITEKQYPDRQGNY